jgi:hypothetical protein
MPLEQWDPVRKRYILYRHPDEQTRDCERYPFEQIPCRIFLDTNVINRLVQWVGQIFEFEPIPDGLNPVVADDVEALRHVLHGLDRTRIELLASSKMIDELRNTPDDALRHALVSYGVEFVRDQISEDDHQFAIDFGRRLVGSQFVASLPHAADQELIGHAIALGCDTFCTCDRKSIIRKRDRLQLPIRLMTPVEWWAHTKPWAGLWS